MKNKKEKKTSIEQAAEDLFNFAIERDDVKWLLGQLPQEAEVPTSTVEYELQILKIVGVGWGISYFLGNVPKTKNAIMELYWRAINEFSKQLSDTTGLMTGQDIDYFQIAKERLTTYIKAMEKKTDVSEPAVTIGKVFAGKCGKKDDLFASLTGTKMFANTLARVRQYLEAVRLV